MKLERDFHISVSHESVYLKLRKIFLIFLGLHPWLQSWVSNTPSMKHCEERWHLQGYPIYWLLFRGEHSIWHGLEVTLDKMGIKYHTRTMKRKWLSVYLYSPGAMAQAMSLVFLKKKEIPGDLKWCMKFIVTRPSNIKSLSLLSL